VGLLGLVEAARKGVGVGRGLISSRSSFASLDGQPSCSKDVRIGRADKDGVGLARRLDGRVSLVGRVVLPPAEQPLLGGKGEDIGLEGLDLELVDAVVGPASGPKVGLDALDEGLTFEGNAGRRGGLGDRREERDGREGEGGEQHQGKGSCCRRERWPRVGGGWWSSVGRTIRQPSVVEKRERAAGQGVRMRLSPPLWPSMWCASVAVGSAPAHRQPSAVTTRARRALGLLRPRRRARRPLRLLAVGGVRSEMPVQPGAATVALPA